MAGFNEMKIMTEKQFKREKRKERWNKIMDSIEESWNKIKKDSGVKTGYLRED